MARQELGYGRGVEVKRLDELLDGLSMEVRTGQQRIEKRLTQIDDRIHQANVLAAVDTVPVATVLEHVDARFNEVEKKLAVILEGRGEIAVSNAEVGSFNVFPSPPASKQLRDRALPKTTPPLKRQRSSVSECSAAGSHIDKFVSERSKTTERIDCEFIRQNSAVSDSRTFTLPMTRFFDQGPEGTAVSAATHWTTTWLSIFGNFVETTCGQGVATGKAFGRKACMEPMIGCFADFVDGPLFRILSMIVILSNFVFIIVQTDYKMANVGQSEPDSMIIAELCFTVFYVWELGSMLLARRRDFFFGRDAMWNLFDVLVVLVSVFELAMTLTGASAINLAFLRILRILKMSRILRMGRPGFSALRAVKEIRIMTDALAGSFVIFLFCALMLITFICVFAIFFVQGCASYLATTPNVDAVLRDAIETDFGSVRSTTVSLFMAVSGGNDWAKYHETVKEVGLAYNFLFLFFIAFFTIAFLNVVTGVFAEKAMAHARRSVDEVDAERAMDEASFAEELHAALENFIGHDGTQTISRDAFDELLSHSKVVRVFRSRGLAPLSARRLFKLLLHTCQATEIDFATFVSSCVKLSGPASSSDLHVLNAQMTALHLKQMRMTELIKHNIDTLSVPASADPDSLNLDSLTVECNLSL